MLGRLTARRSTLGIRRCCACGYCGHFAQLGADAAKAAGAHCPRCGCDFANRPPRSYAEMEGLELTARGTLAPRDPKQYEAMLVERWLAFLFAIVVAIAIAGYLCSLVVRPLLPVTAAETAPETTRQTARETARETALEPLVTESATPNLDSPDDAAGL